jgi:hypothetical protein
MSDPIVLTDPTKFALVPFTAADDLGAVAVTYGGQVLFTISSDLAKSLGRALTLMSEEVQSNSSLLTFFVNQGVPEDIAVSISAHICGFEKAS